MSIIVTREETLEETFTKPVTWNLDLTILPTIPSTLKGEIVKLHDGSTERGGTISMKSVRNRSNQQSKDYVFVSAGEQVKLIQVGRLGTMDIRCADMTLSRGAMRMEIDSTGTVFVGSGAVQSNNSMWETFNESLHYYPDVDDFFTTKPTLVKKNGLEEVFVLSFRGYLYRKNANDSPVYKASDVPLQINVDKLRNYYFMCGSGWFNFVYSPSP